MYMLDWASAFLLSESILGIRNHIPFTVQERSRSSILSFVPGSAPRENPMSSLAETL